MGHEDTQLMNCRKLKMILIYSIFVWLSYRKSWKFLFTVGKGFIEFKDALQGAVQKNALHAASLSQALVTVNQNLKKTTLLIKNVFY